MPTFLRPLPVAGGCIALALALAAGCHHHEDRIAPFHPSALQQDEREAARSAPMRPPRPLPTTLQSPFASNGNGAATHPTTAPATGQAIGADEPFVRIPLREIVQRAVANSLDVKVAGYQPAIDETRVTEAEARFDPTFFTNVSYAVDRQLAPTPNNPTLGTNQELAFRTYDLQVGVRQDLESGGKVELRYEPRYTHRSPAFGFGGGINPFWTSEVTLQITQPLLRDFGADVNRARITINKNNQRISLLDFRDALEKNLGDIEEAYWNLVEAELDVRIFEELLNRTQVTGNILWQRRTQDVGRVQLSQASSSLEQRRTALIRARAHVRDLSDQIKRLMNDPELPVASNTLILPGDQPLQEQIRFNLEDQISTAMENRLELGQQQLRSENAAVAAEVAKNNLLPQFNFVGSVSAQGLGSQYVDSVNDEFTNDHLGYSIGIQMEIPIGNRAAKAIWRRAKLQRLQAIDQYRALIEQVSMEVKQSAREVDTTWEEMAGTRATRFAAADALAAIEERERGGDPLTPEFVNRKLDLQQQLAEAQRLEAQSIARYQIAISKLEKAKGTLLRYNNVIMEEAPLQRASAVR